MSDIAIKVENLGKSYLVGHNSANAERYTALRDVIARNTKHLARKTRDMLTGRPIVQGDEVEEFWALKDINFEIKQGERVGIIGRNGSGKSTLLKILSRITEPSRGRISINGRVASLLEVGTGFHPELTGRENIFLNGAILGMSRSEIQRKFDEIVDFAEVEKFLDTPVKRYSSGMYVRLAFSVAAHLEPEILIIDEVLAVGDIRFQEKCIGKMNDVAKSGKTVLFVSHSMESIKRLCEKTILLQNGKFCEIGYSDKVVSKYLTAETKSINCDIEFSNKGSFFIEKIELTNENEEKVSDIKTWDDVIFKIYFYSEENIKSGSAVLKISSPAGICLSLVSTQPDQGVSTPFKKGWNLINCRINRFPFSAGSYLIGAGLAIPNAQWLYEKWDHAVINVLPDDVYGSGLAPSSDRYCVALDVDWQVG